MKCPRCGGEMSEGYVLDRGDNGYKWPQMWVEGEPEESFWANGLKTSNRKVFKVQAFRCADCKYLEFYTTERIYI
ncbi:MAG TPA: PF20097 family protein [Pyrinomonadaceae bacterium]